MKVLVACEYSGIVRDAFTSRGHDAMSCDLLPTESPGKHYQGDVFDIINDGFDLMIAHPPCTHLAVSGARHFYKKEKEQAMALEFVRNLLEADIKKIALENPVSVISSRIRKPDQIIQPYQFGHDARKTTCLWLKDLPLLVATKIVEPRLITLSNGKTFSADYMEGVKRSRSGESMKHRSRTYQGIADAMAEQWGGVKTGVQVYKDNQVKLNF